MLCHALPCFAMLCHALPCFAMLSHGLTCFYMLLNTFICFYMLLYAFTHFYTLLHAFTCFYVLLHAFTCFYPLCKLSSFQDLGVGLVLIMIIVIRDFIFISSFSLGISTPVGDAVPDVLAPVLLPCPARAPQVVEGRQVDQHRCQRVGARLILYYKVLDENGPHPVYFTFFPPPSLQWELMKFRVTSMTVRNISTI